jgi:hypothetical protein
MTKQTMHCVMPKEKGIATKETTTKSRAMPKEQSVPKRSVHLEQS